MRPAKATLDDTLSPLPSLELLLDALVARIAPAVAELVAERLAGTRDPVSRRPLTKGELAAELPTSLATIDRFVREGLPHSYVGASRRFDLEACRAWCAARGKRPAAPALPKASSVSLAGVTRIGGRR